MITATKLHSPGNKYDVDEIRKRIKQHGCRGLCGRTLGQQPLSAMLAEHFAAGLPPGWFVDHQTQPILEAWWLGPFEQGLPQWFDDLSDWYEWPDVGEWGFESRLIWRPDFNHALRNHISSAARLQLAFDDSTTTCECASLYLPSLCQVPPNLEVHYGDPKFYELIDRWLTDVINQILSIDIWTETRPAELISLSGQI
jgi:hypothetical protein